MAAMDTWPGPSSHPPPPLASKEQKQDPWAQSSGVWGWPAKLVLALRSSLLQWAHRADLEGQMVLKLVLFKPSLTVGGWFRVPSLSFRAEGRPVGSLPPKGWSRTTHMPTFSQPPPRAHDFLPVTQQWLYKKRFNKKNSGIPAGISSFQFSQGCMLCNCRAVKTGKLQGAVWLFFLISSFQARSKGALKLPSSYFKWSHFRCFFPSFLWIGFSKHFHWASTWNLQGRRANLFK